MLLPLTSITISYWRRIRAVRSNLKLLRWRFVGLWIGCWQGRRYILSLSRSNWRQWSLRYLLLPLGLLISVRASWARLHWLVLIKLRTPALGGLAHLILTWEGVCCRFTVINCKRLARLLVQLVGLLALFLVCRVCQVICFFEEQCKCLLRVPRHFSERSKELSICIFREVDLEALQTLKLLRFCDGSCTVDAILILLITRRSQESEVAARLLREHATTAATVWRLLEKGCMISLAQGAGASQILLHHSKWLVRTLVVEPRLTQSLVWLSGEARLVERLACAEQVVTSGLRFDCGHLLIKCFGRRGLLVLLN